MKRNNLKSAFEDVYFQEFDRFPSRHELEQKYTFSHSFITEMEELIAQVNKTYIVLFGRPFQRNFLVLILAMAIILPIGRLYFTGKIDRNRARLVLAIAEAILLSAFGVSIQKATRNFTRSYKTAFTDSNENDRADNKNLDFAIPVPPEGYNKTNEYRTAVSHMIEFKDSMGRIIRYDRVDIRQGVLTKIDTANSVLTKTKVNDVEAVYFTHQTESNLIWADRYYRYHLKGNCPVETLIEIANTII